MARNSRYRWQNERRALARSAKAGGPAEYLNGKPRPGGKPRVPKRPTEKQRAYIRFLAHELGRPIPDVTSRRAASDWISEMEKRLPAHRKQRPTQ